MIENKITDNLVADLSLLFSFASSISLAVAHAYKRSVSDIYKTLVEVSKVTDNDRAEQLFMKMATQAMDMRLYQKVEAGDTTFLGNVRFSKPVWSPRVSMPKYFAPVLEMMSRAGYQPIESNYGVSRQPILTMSTDDCLALLNVIESGLVAVDFSEVTWKIALQSSMDIYRKNLDQINRIKTHPFENISDANNAMAWYSSTVGEYAPMAVWEGLAPIYSYLFNSASAALSWIEQSLTER